MGTRWYLTFEARDPRNPELGRWKTGIQERLYKQMQVSGHEKAIARIYLVAEVLQVGTSHLFEGWCRPDKDADCFVYVGRPARDFKSLTIETPPPTGMVFLVFVLADGTIDEWTWRPVSDVEGEDAISGINGKLIWSTKPS